MVIFLVFFIKLFCLCIKYCMNLVNNSDVEITVYVLCLKVKTVDISMRINVASRHICLHIYLIHVHMCFL